MLRAQDTELLRVLQENQQTAQEYNLIFDYYHILQSKLPEMYPSICNVQAYGSMEMGFGVKGSDLDITLKLREGEQERGTLKELVQVVSSEPIFEVVEEVLNDRVAVPLLRCRFGSVDVDITCNQHDGVRDANFLRKYATLSPLVRDLVILVKVWAKKVMIYGAKYGNLPSLAWTILVIYFLQVKKGLPHLSRWLPHHESMEDSSTFSRVDSVPELFRQFITFYGDWHSRENFEWSKEVASIRKGRPQTRCTIEQLQQLERRPHYIIHIEHPFDITENLGGKLKRNTEKMLKKSFQNAHYELSNFQTPFW